MVLHRSNGIFLIALPLKYIVAYPAYTPGCVISHLNVATDPDTDLSSTGLKTLKT